MSQPYSINLSTSHSNHPHPSFTCLPSPLPFSLVSPYLRRGNARHIHADSHVQPKVHMHTLKHTHTLIKQQFSGSLFSRYTSKIKSPAGENWGKREREKNRVRQRDQLNYKNNAAGLIGFSSKFVLQCGMNLNGEKWEKRLVDLRKETKGRFLSWRRTESQKL